MDTARHEQWHRHLAGSLAIRVAGIALVALAWVAGRALVAPALHPLFAAMPDVVLATVAFVAASIGSAAAVMGGHLFDPIAVSSPWR
ncbi:MAG: hypothetical protein ACRYFW_07105 [Janthinobacterium lividum]